jgi:anti-sigma factor ChrR (cupin superfamily)
MINMDLSQRVVINTNEQDWQQSPMQGVWRKPLAREDMERGQATSIVRYEAGASFSEHNHPLGEEILVLEGMFSDQTGDYHAGTYFRNPEGFIHAPFSQKGCVVLVKLHQFQSNDSDHITIDTRSTEWLPGNGGLQVMPLHSFATEQVALVKWPAGERFQPHTHFGGEEILCSTVNLRMS